MKDDPVKPPETGEGETGSPQSEGLAPQRRKARPSSREQEQVLERKIRAAASLLKNVDGRSLEFETSEPDLAQSLELKQREYELAHSNDVHRLRLKYTGMIYWLVVSWLAGVFACILLAGFHAWGFTLSEKVIIAFITSTTINVVGLFVLVAKWLYPAPSGKDRRRFGIGQPKN